MACQPFLVPEDWSLILVTRKFKIKPFCKLFLIKDLKSERRSNEGQEEEEASGQMSVVPMFK